MSGQWVGKAKGSGGNPSRLLPVSAANMNGANQVIPGKVWLAIGTFLTLLLPASGAAADEPLPVGITQEELFGTMLRSSKWTRMPIGVCWENPSAENLDNRALVRRAVEETWVSNSAVRFAGWEACDQNTPGLRIRIADEEPHTKALGYYLDRYPAGMVLNFQFTNWSRGCTQTRDFCIYAVAAHEFGHALGFTHEQNRNDAPAECRAERSGTTGDYKVTRFDRGSIMSYCNPDWNGNGKLSGLDIQAVQTVYGKP
jgi:Astacin (Peptidase family M12A)